MRFRTRRNKPQTLSDSDSKLGAFASRIALFQQFRLSRLYRRQLSFWSARSITVHLPDFPVLLAHSNHPYNGTNLKHIDHIWYYLSWLRYAVSIFGFLDYNRFHNYSGNKYFRLKIPDINATGCRLKWNQSWSVCTTYVPPISGWLLTTPKSPVKWSMIIKGKAEWRGWCRGDNVNLIELNADSCVSGQPAVRVIADSYVTPKNVRKNELKCWG